MNIVVIGGTGLIGAGVVERLVKQGHEVRPASPSTGVDAMTGAGLASVLVGAHVVIDVANSPSIEDSAVLTFFETTSRNLTKAETEAGVQHHVVLSIVGADRLTDSGYFRAKHAQEQLVECSDAPYTIVRSTQFFEFLGTIAAANTDGNVVRLSNAAFQPIAAEDVAEALAKVALAAPLNGRIEIAGPDRFSLSGAVGQYLSARSDTRAVVVDPARPYFGAIL
jgi:uncharacterized protein YbjT (DUF2867 family)